LEDGESTVTATGHSTQYGRKIENGSVID
jgi:hypothetical protein